MRRAVLTDAIKITKKSKLKGNSKLKVIWLTIVEFWFPSISYAETEETFHPQGKVSNDWNLGL
jgi:hypothetical protein